MNNDSIPDFLKGLFARPSKDGWVRCQRCDKVFMFIRGAE